MARSPVVSANQRLRTRPIPEKRPLLYQAKVAGSCLSSQALCAVFTTTTLLSSDWDGAASRAGFSTSLA